VNPVKSYLTLPDFGPKLVGLRWSSNDNSLEFAVGHFAFAEEIAEFLEGFAHVRRIVHFAFMVRLLQLLRQAPDESEAADSARRRLLLLVRQAPAQSEAACSARWRLWKLFTDTKGSLRSAGAFCGRLCHDIPAALEANQVADICRRLRSREPLSAFLGDRTHDAGAFIQVITLGYQPPELPPFDADVFEGKVTDAFQSCSDEEAVFWFKYGRAPIDANAARTLAQAVPPTLAGRLASLLTRTRLTRARVWVAQLLGALSLPPRRLAHQELPLGGYSDVTTRGQVDQILLSQFALDEWDFFRRFAEGELLYFRREDPRDQTRQELVVVLDQGVRTWGDVRLVLGAALLALGKHALLRGHSFSLATTSVDTIDPLQVDEESLGEMVEACDLSAHPGLALERVLEQSSKKDRDIVLLTHPRNLDEEEVRAAAKRMHPGARLFALTLDRHGHAELSEFKHGVPVAIRQFRVDYSMAPAESAAAPPLDAQKWTGDVEPIGFPFRFGVGGKIGAGCFDFDFAGNYLLTVGPQSVLYLSDVRANLVEILPRAMWQGKVVQWSTSYVLGVANGFVVAGVHAVHTLAVHIDLESRKCTCRLVGDSNMACLNWNYSPAHHCLIVSHAGGGVAIDLSTGERFATNLGGHENRAQDAWRAWERCQVPARQIPIAIKTEQPRRGALVRVDHDRGTVGLSCGPMRIDPQSGQTHFLWTGEFTPITDGKPMLRDYMAMAAQYGGLNLALQTSRVRGPGLNDTRLHLFRGPEGIPLGEYQTGAKMRAFRLSANGELLARQLGDAVIQISQVAGNITNLGRTAVGGFTQELPFVLGKDRLMMLPGRHAFLLDWSNGKLEFAYHSTRGSAPEVKYGVGATLKDIPEACKYDTIRWRLGASNTLLAASDRYGQLAVFDRRQNLICMFFAFRTRLAGWMPDGTCFTQVSTADGASLTHFGRALLATSRQERTS
jgi:hypothetical protein